MEIEAQGLCASSTDIVKEGRSTEYSRTIWSIVILDITFNNVLHIPSFFLKYSPISLTI